MALFLLKTLLAALVIAIVSWLSGKKTGLAGFLTALPLTTLLALAFSQVEWRNSEQSILYAKSVFAAVPVSLLFFVPFLIAGKFQWSFWFCYFLGLLFLGVGYLIHSKIVPYL